MTSLVAMATRRMLVGERIFGASRTAQMMTLVTSVMRINAKIQRLNLNDEDKQR